MKRVFLSIVLSGILCTVASAAPVTRKAACKSAEKFLQERGIDAKLTPQPSHAPGRSATTATEPYHIFNIGTGDGYIIISGDDRTRTVLAYSDCGSIDHATMPEACAEWLRQYADEINYIQQTDEEPVYNITAAQGITYSPIAVTPMLKSQWDQGYPYNLNCPVDKSNGEKCVTGCVATATAQIMYYYRYPERPTGTITYQDNTQEETRDFDFSSIQSFDWSSMTDTYDNSSTAESRNAVATLMTATGHGIKMQYSSGISLAYHRNAGEALMDYFGYDRNMHYYERRLMSDQEWTDLITAELQAGRPILYDGKNPSMGHTFICDGYDGNGFFHFNWGWSGLCNGFFSLSALIPSQQATGGSDNGYTHNQAVICHIAPPGHGDSTPQTDHTIAMMQLYFRDAKSYYAANSTPSIKIPLTDAQFFFYTYNIGYQDFDGEIWAVKTDGNTFTPIVQAKYLDYSPKYPAWTFPLAESNLGEGTHRIGFYYKLPGSDQWHRITGGITDPTECFVTVNGDNATLSSIIPQAEIELASDFDPGILYTGYDKTWTLDIKNTGEIRLEGYAGIALVSTDNTSSYFFHTSILCPAGETAAMSIMGSFKDIEAGQYNIIPFYTFSSTPTTENIIPLAQEPVEVKVRPELVITPPYGNIPYFVMDRNDTSVKLSLTKLGTDPWEGIIRAYISSTDGTTFPGYLEGDFKVNSNTSITATLYTDGDLDVESGVHKISFYLDKNREMQLTTNTIVVTDNNSGIETAGADKTTISVEKGVIRITSSVPVTEVKLTDISGRTTLCEYPGTGQAMIDTSSLADGIYIVTVRTATGTTATKARIKSY